MQSSEVFRRFLIAAVLCFVCVTPYPYYQTYVPNGDRVPDPCDQSTVWQGVGHRNPGGAGSRNPFGLDFATNNHNWTAICNMDSDGDGRSNGLELGDPNCSWQRGQPSPNAANLTHPGICEPIDSAGCQRVNSWLTCPSPFNCPAIHQPDVQNITLRLPVTHVPTAQTTYMCYGMVLPNETDHHVIALTPVITNYVVDHHMLLYVCKTPPRNPNVFVNATTCQMDVWGCLSLMGIWSVGVNGQCFANEFGFRIGPNGYQYAVLQVHWNNAYGQQGGNEFVDSSGFTIFYTSQLRRNDGAILMTGQEYLEIPPGLESTKFSGGCSSLCTAALPGPINVTAALLHMHLSGKSGDILIVRQGGSVDVLTNQTTYDYNSPELLSYNPAIPFQPGDQFRVDCNYNSIGRTNTTYWGLSTTDEMCYGFITYYPANDNFQTCLQWRTVNGYCIAGFVDCDLTTFQVMSSTLHYICKGALCPVSCRRALQTIAETGCMSGAVEQEFLYKDPTGMSALISVMAWCGVSVPAMTTTPGLSSAGRLVTSSWLFYVSIIVIALTRAPATKR